MHAFPQGIHRRSVNAGPSSERVSASMLSDQQFADLENTLCCKETFIGKDYVNWLLKDCVDVQDIFSGKRSDIKIKTQFMIDYGKIHLE
ncbi:hypothetical protein Ciccas_009482 [Cichlidogyrus casuarinus]|uniref:Uncharacterized protein n=1 Tax=Cichlidogyrus casuarinus TaxID=1844966 RepID=A0ABD2PZP4_9PLAT